MANNINFKVGFSVDKAGLNQALKELKEIQKVSANDMFKIKGGDFSKVNQELKEAKEAAKTVEKALQEAFNPRLNTVDFQKLNSILKSSYTNVDELRNKLAGAGASGVNAFNNIQNSLTSLNQKMKTSDSLLDKIGKTLANTIRWQLSSSIVNKFSGSIQEAYGYVKHLDTALNDIRIVTQKSADEMDRFAQRANTAAQSLGKSTNDYAEASLLYYQQGLGDEEVAARTETTLKAANVTGQSASEVSEQLTSVWNGFQVTAENTEKSVDMLAAVAATTASDLEELSTAMSKVASAANMMGVSQEQLTAMLSTVISVTREAPETVGQAFKTIFARVSDIEEGLDDEFASLGNYSGKLAAYGVNVLDINGDLRDMGEVIEEIGGNWANLTREQQISIAQTMAGQRQYSKLIALFDNWDQYTQSINTAENSMGTLQQQQDIYMESTAAHLEKMGAALENVYDSFLDTDTINTFADAVTNVANILAGFIDSLGGGEAVLLNLGAIATRVFSNQIAGSITKSVKEMQDMKNLANQSKFMFEFFKGDQQAFAATNGLEDNQKRLMAVKEQIQQASSAFSEEELNNIQNQIDKIQELINKNNEYAEATERVNKLNITANEDARPIKYGEDYDQDYVDAITDANEQLKNIQNQLKETESSAKDAFKNLSKDSQGFADALQEMGIENVTEGLNDQFEFLNNEIKTLQKNGESLISNDLINFSKKQKEELAKAQEQFKNNIITENQYKAKLGEITQAVVEKTTTVTSEIQKEIQANEALKQKAAEMAATQSELYDAQTRLAEQTKNQVNLQSLNQSITTIIGSIGQLGTAITSISSLFKIWDNDTLSLQEKLGQTFTNLLFVVPQVVTGTMGLINGVSTLTKNQIVLEAATKLLTAAERKNLIVTTEEGVAHLTFAGILKTVKYAAIEAATALWSFLAPFAPILIAVAALGAAIAGIAWINDAPRRELEKLKEEAEAAKESTQKLQEQIEQFNDLSSGYLDAANTLEQLVEGSDEYTESLEKANEQAKQLLELMPQLAQYADFSGDLIKIDPDAIEALSILQTRAAAGAEIDTIGKSNQALSSEKALLSANGLSAEQTRALISSMEGDFTESSLNKAIEKNLDLFTEYVTQNVPSGNGMQQVTMQKNPSVEEIKNKIEDLDELKIIANKIDLIDNQIKSNNDSLSNILKQTISDWDQSSKGEQASARKALEASINSDEYNKLYNESVKNYKNYSSDILKAAFEQSGGVLTEEQKEEKTAKQNQIMIEYLAQLDASTKQIQTITDSLKLNREESLKNTEILNEKSGIKNLNQDLIDFLGGETDIDAIIPPSLKEQALQAIDDLYNDGFFEKNKELLNTLGITSEEAAKDAINQFKEEIKNTDWTDTTNSFKQKLQDAIGDSREFDQLAGLNVDTIFDKLYKDFDGSQEKLNDIFNIFNELNFEDSNIARQVDILSNKFNDGTISAEEYADALNKLKESVSLEDLDFEGIAENNGLDTEDSDNIKDLAKILMDDAEASEELSDNLADNANDAAELAAQILKMNDAIDTLSDNFDKWSDILKNSSKGSREYLETMRSMTDAVADLFDVSSDVIDEDFIINNLDLIGEAAKGNTEAIDQLRSSLDEEIIADITLNGDEAFVNKINALDAQCQDFAAKYANLEVNADVNDQGFIDAINDMIDTAQMTEDEVNAYLAGIGYTPEFDDGAEASGETMVPVMSTTVTPSIDWSSLNLGNLFGNITLPTITLQTTSRQTGQVPGQPAEFSVPGFSGSTNTGGKGKSRKVVGLKKRASASSVKNYTSKPSSSGSGSGGNKGGGGGGGGGGNSQDPKQKELLEEQADRYHDINIELQNINKDLERLENTQKKLTGRELIDNLNKQLDILNKQVDAYQRKVDIAKVELAENRTALSQMGVTFDADGQISNYTQAYQAALKKYNDAITAYNLMSAEEQESTGEAAVELAQKEYEKFKEKLERYDELINDVIPELEDNIQEAIDKQIELNIEKFKMEIEVRLDMADAERSWNEFKKKVIDGIKDDDYLGIIKSQYSDLLSYFNTAGTGKGPIQALTEQLNGTLDQLKSMDGTLGNWASSYGDNQAAALEDLQTYLDELMNQMMDVEDLVKDIEDTYLDMIDAIKDAFEEQLDNYELIDDIIEHNKNVIELLYGDKAYDQMAQYYDKQEQNNLQQLDFLRQEADFWKQKMDAEEQGSEAWKQYKENWQDALGNLNDQVENSIETLIDKYTNLIDSIFDKLNNKISGGLGLDYLSTEWDLINKNADEYLDTINRAFETQKLQEKFNEALANNTGLKAQQQIKNLMDQQLGDLEQREKLTQYDVERAEKLLDIELKKIALQDAQQNKSKMRLRRDAQGNYSYQFVSDEQKIADAQKELAEAQNSLYNFDKDRYQQNLNEIYDTYNEFQEKLKELYANTALSDEERERQKTLLIQQYGELINAKTEQNAQIRLNLEQSAFNELAKMYNTNIDEFNAMTEEQRNALMEGLIPYWNSGIQEMVNTFAGEGGFIPVCSESFKDLEEATKDYVDSLNEIEAAAGVNFDSIAQGYDKNIELAQELIVKNDELISQYERELSAVQDVLSAVRDLATEYAAVKKNAIEASEAAMKYAQEEAKRKAEAAEEERKKLEAANQSTSNSSSSGSTATKPSTSTSTTSSSSNKKINSINDVKVGDKLKFVSGRYYYTSYGAQPSGDYNLGREVSVIYKNPGAPYPVALHGTGNTPWDLGWVKLDQLEKLKTGGYTGDFGNEGRIGVLHEKELVLNSNDTENMLSAISVLRGLSDVLGAKTLMNLSNALDKIKVNSNIKNNNNEDVCEQQVTITANFPNVNSSNEIEEAINNLINTAAQRRNRRGR